MSHGSSAKVKWKLNCWSLLITGRARVKSIENQSNGHLIVQTLSSRGWIVTFYDLLRNIKTTFEVRRFRFVDSWVRIHFESVVKYWWFTIRDSKITRSDLDTDYTELIRIFLNFLVLVRSGPRFSFLALSNFSTLVRPGPIFVEFSWFWSGRVLDILFFTLVQPGPKFLKFVRSWSWSVDAWVQVYIQSFELNF